MTVFGILVHKTYIFNKDNKIISPIFPFLKGISRVFLGKPKYFEKTLCS